MGIYSKDLRIGAVDAVDRGVPRREVGRRRDLLRLSHDARTSVEDEEGGRGPLGAGTSTGRKKRRILATLEEKEASWGRLEENDDATPERHCRRRMWEGKTGGVAVSGFRR